jgi:uncharacterized RDD family membrane protein YckC
MRLTDHESGVGSSQSDHLPPKWIQRIVAFGMDLILFVVILQLVVMFLPKLYGEGVEKEFQDLIFSASQLNPEDRFDTEKVGQFYNEADISKQTLSMIGFIVVCAFTLPVFYCFFGEFFFRGKSLGKATFGLQAVSRRDGFPPRFPIALSRSLIKGMAMLCLLTPFFLPGLLNFLFAFFNRERRCLHDFLTGSLTVQSRASHSQLKTTEES